MSSASEPNEPGLTFRARLARLVVKTALRHPRLTAFVPESFRSRFRRRLRSAMYEGKAVRRLSDGECNGTPGVNVHGLLESPIGVGEQARSLVRSLRAASIPTALVPFDEEQLAGKRSFDPHETPHVVNLCVVNAENVKFFLERAGADRFRSRFNIGYWAWELERFPQAWDECAGFFDEIWVLSSFIQQAVSARIATPVVCMPGGVEIISPIGDHRASFGIPVDRTAVLCMFDFSSHAERKNPWATIEAVKLCRARGQNPFLVVKSGGSDSSSTLERLRKEVDSLGGILIDRRLSREDSQGLQAACDIVMSLHRSEGYGLILAEAMALGKPVVATGYSGNLDFMNANNSFPIRWRMTAIERDIGPYPAGYIWAEPDIEHAAETLCRLLEDPELCSSIGRRAAADIANRLNPRITGLRMRERLVALGLI